MALDIWGRIVADDSDYLIAEAEKANRVRAAVAAHQAQHAPAHNEPAVPRESDPPPMPAPTVKTQAVQSATQPSAARRAVADPVHTLDEALAAAVDDLARGVLMAAAPKAVREQLVALWGYRALMRATLDPYDEFERAMDGAANDSDRATLIAGCDPAFLVEWAWRTRATSDDWRRRYLALTAGDEV